MTGIDSYHIYGVQNRPDNRKIVLTAQHSTEYRCEKSELSKRGRFSGQVWIDAEAGDIGKIPRDAGAHELYVHVSTEGVGVGEPLPAGATLVDFGWNGATYSTVRPDGTRGPLDEVWSG